MISLKGYDGYVYGMKRNSDIHDSLTSANISPVCKQNLVRFSANN